MKLNYAISIVTSILRGVSPRRKLLFVSLTTGKKENYRIDKNGICISSVNRTEWSPTRSVIIGVKTKSDDRAAGI